MKLEIKKWLNNSRFLPQEQEQERLTREGCWGPASSSELAGLQPQEPGWRTSQGAQGVPGEC